MDWGQRWVRGIRVRVRVRVRVKVRVRVRWLSSPAKVMYTANQKKTTPTAISFCLLQDREITGCPRVGIGEG